MKIFKNKKDLINTISEFKNVAFVPTMGSLHEGHLSLISKAKKETKNVLVSIYVNPKQFNNASDFKKYPKNISKDIRILKNKKIKFLFLPSYRDIYQFNSKNKIYMAPYSKILCGKFRKGHFKGVVDVVNRFLEIVNPKTIYLGMKDYQQLRLIKDHIKKNDIKTKVKECKIIRERSGIPFSSRNLRLSKKQKVIASYIYSYLKKNKKVIFELCLKNKKKIIIKKLLNLGINKVEYLECININKIKIAKSKIKKFNIFIAYFLGNIRLIDNL